MNLAGNFLTTLGEVLIAYTVIKVHSRVREEHQIDKRVFAEMIREKKIGITGIAFLVIGFILRLPEIL